MIETEKALARALVVCISTIMQATLAEVEGRPFPAANLVPAEVLGREVLALAGYKIALKKDGYYTVEEDSS